MKMSEEFTSKYLKGADIMPIGREIKVVMSNCEREEVGMKDGKPDYKPVLYFKGKDKGVVLNKTNATVISDFYGDDSADWYDQPLILFSVMADFNGKVGPAIRCRVPTAKDNRVAVPKEDPISSGPIDPPRRAVGGVSDAALNDDIPF